MALEYVTKKVTTWVPDWRPGAKLDKDGKPVKIKVRSKEPAKVPKFPLTQEGLAEACEYYKAKGGIGYVMETFNVQNLTFAMNDIRRQMAPGSVSEAKLSEMAQQKVLSAMGSDPTGPIAKAVQERAGDWNRIVTEVIGPIKDQLRGEYSSGNTDLFVIDEDDDTDE